MGNPVNFEELFGPMGPGRAELDELIKSVQGLSRNTKALAKNLDSDGPRIATGLAAIREQTAGLRDQAAALDGMTQQERKSLAALGQQVAELAKQQQQYQQAQAGQKKLYDDTTAATREASSAVAVLRRELKDAYAAGDAERLVKAAQGIRDYKQQTDQLSKALRGMNSEFTAVAGSYNRLSIETQQLGERIRALPGGFDATSTEAQKLKKEFFDNTQRLKDFDRELNQNFREVGSYAKGIMEAVAALSKQRDALLAQRQALVLQNNATGLSADQYVRLRQEIDKTDAELRKVTTDLNSYGAAAGKSSASTGFLSKAGGDLKSNFIGAYLSITALLAGLKQVFAENAKYSDQLADVRKTTGLTREATDELADSLKKLETPTDLSSLLDIAKVAGQLGIAGKDVGEFTKSIDVAVQALGDDFTGGAEEIATILGKIGVVFRNELGEDQAKNIQLIGSAVNELGAAGAATAPYLADVALRAGASAAQARLGLKDVLAYAASLQETGFQSEVAGTGLQRLFSTLSTRTEAAFNIAKLGDANLTLSEFRHLVNTDFQGAITSFLRGLREGGTTTTRFNQLLGTLKLQTGEAKSVITSLAQNVDVFADKQAIANEQLQQGTSLAAEAAIKGDTLAGSWKRLSREVGEFFTSGGGSRFLKVAVDFFEKGIGTTLAGRGFLEKKKVDDYGVALADVALTQRKAADETERLLARFERLKVAVAGTKDYDQLRETVLALKDRFGDTAVTLNETTGQFDLNTVAVTKNYRAQRQAFLDNATALAKRLQDLENERSQSYALSQALEEEAAVKEKLVRANTTLKTGSLSQLDTDVAQRSKTPTVYDRQDGAVKPEVLAAYSQYVDLTNRAGTAANKAALAESRRDIVLRQLERLGLDSSAALALLAKSTRDAQSADDADIETKKKKKQAVADVLKAQLELRKFELEQQAKDFDRQAANVANSDEVRTRAVNKARAARVEIARLDEQEAIHAAELKNAKLIGGDKALAVERQLIHKQFLARIRELGLNSDKELLALAQATADQLAAIDKESLEAEVADLERVAQDENKSYGERQVAAETASARRIELIQLESDIKRRAAKGDAEVVKLIDAEEKTRVDAEVKKRRPNNSDFTNADAQKQYTADQAGLEAALGGQLTARAEYARQAENLDIAFLEKRVANLKADTTKQQEAAEAELELQRRKNALKLKNEEQTEQERQSIIQQGLATTQAFADAFFQFSSDQRAADLENARRVYDAELAVAGDNLALKAQAEENYRKREYEARLKAAKYEKAQALFSIAINTALAVTSVLSTGGGAHYLDFGTSAGILSALVTAAGIAQAIAVAAKPLPTYFKGRTGGPAEAAIVAERGPELVGRPGSYRLVAEQAVTQLYAGDRVYTAPETRSLLAQHDLIEGRLVQRAEQATVERQTTQLRQGAALRQQAELRAQQATNREVIAKLEEVRRTIEELERERVSKSGEFERWRKQGDSWTQHVNKRYRNG